MYCSVNPRETIRRYVTVYYLSCCHLSGMRNSCLWFSYPKLCQHFILKSGWSNIFTVGSRNWKQELTLLPFLDDNSVFHCLLFLKLYTSNIHCYTDTVSKSRNGKPSPPCFLHSTVCDLFTGTGQTFRVLGSGKACLWNPSSIICGWIKTVCSSVYHCFQQYSVIECV